MNSLDQPSPEIKRSDYDFIIAEPTEQQQLTPKRQLHPKVIMLIVLVLAMLVVLSLLAVQKKKTTTTVSVSAGSAIAKQFIGDIQANNDTAAYNMIAIPADYSKTIFLQTFATPLREHYVLSECSYVTKGASDITAFTVTCPSDIANNRVTITVETTTVKGKGKVMDYLTEQPS